jgi:hypothetical protein
MSNSANEDEDHDFALALEYADLCDLMLKLPAKSALRRKRTGLSFGGHARLLADEVEDKLPKLKVF